MIATDAKIKKDIRLFSKTQLEEMVVGLGEKKFRAAQIYEWLWQRSVMSFEEMTNLSKDFRLKLSDNFTINAIKHEFLSDQSDPTIHNSFL